ncbi:glycosyltransferase [Phragmitibacter flavus]|uniref:Glycosyltransferase n=1 Tax=Phragmitibacter flavus TaxID=2576071 RepID=A0A5R8KD25_9BACT|nr:glycosyltransferase [Phragmitibacter flavus]TLD70206.1 glycosyltransferase [Phragmitibacter flavus]
MIIPSYSFFPLRISAESAWTPHLPFAYDLVRIQNPRQIVELRSWSGDAFFTFCQSVADHQLGTRCSAIGHKMDDPLQIDQPEHQQNYAAFARMLKTEPSKAVAEFDDHTIDLLHLDGFHAGATVAEDFATWFPKVREGGVVLFHDIHGQPGEACRDRGAGRLWNEIKKSHQTYSFSHGRGLGILVKGHNDVMDSWLQEVTLGPLGHYYANRGLALSMEAERKMLEAEIEKLRQSHHRMLNTMAGENSPGPLKPDDARRAIEVGRISSNPQETKGNADASSNHHRRYLEKALEATRSGRNLLTVVRKKWMGRRLISDQALRKIDQMIEQEEKALIRKRPLAVFEGRKLAIDRCSEVLKQARTKRWTRWLVRSDEMRKLKQAKQTVERNLKAWQSAERKLQAKKVPLLFDARHYLSQWEAKVGQQDHQVTLDNALEHYQSTGWKIQLDPHPLFHVGWYLGRNADVAATGMEPMRHYLTQGAREGRWPNPLFDPVWYLANYPEVARMPMEPLTHFIQTGAKEGRSPHRKFCPVWYSKMYGSQMGDADALTHFITTGCQTGCLPLPEFETHSDRKIFDRVGLDAKSIIQAYGHGEIIDDVKDQNWWAESHAVFPPPLVKEQCLADAEQRYQSLLSGHETIVLPTSDHPEVSIVITAFNKPALLLRCLESLSKHLDGPSEVIIWDDASTENMDALYDKLFGARVLKSSINLNFVLANNEAAKHARSEFLLLLNTDAFVRENALSSSLALIKSNPKIGIVGGCLILPDGRVQEAGNAIWSDASCAGIGRGMIPDHPFFEQARAVDYCSGAYFLVRRELWDELGGFDVDLAPAYYEETDFCLRALGKGYLTVYNPMAKIDHFEFGTNGQLAAVGRMQQNQRRICDKHRELLLACPMPNDWRSFYTKRRPGQLRVIFLDDLVPSESLGSGFPRALAILSELASAEMEVILCTLAQSSSSVESQPRHQALRWVTLATCSNREQQRDLLLNLLPDCDAVLVSRPHNKPFLSSILETMANDEKSKKPMIIYDAEAIFAEREVLRHRVVYGREMPQDRARKLVENELALAETSDALIAVTPADLKKFQAVAPGKKMMVLGHAVSAQEESPRFEERRGMFFVGPILSDDTPNADAIYWFLDNVIPLIWKTQLIPLRMAGRAVTRRLYEYLGENIVHLGIVDDIEPEFARARVFVCPTRFAAGMPLKMVQAMANGVPIVCTTLVATQLTLTHEVHVLVADSPKDFARAILRLHEDEELWRRLRDACLSEVKQNYSPELLAKNVAQIRNWISSASIADSHSNP